MSIKINKLSINLNQKGYKQDKNGLSRTILSRDFFNQESKLPELFALIEIKKINGIEIEALTKLLDIIEWKIISRVQKIYNSINERKSFQTDNLSEHLLELILKSLNGEIKDIIEEKDFINLSDINIFIGVLEPFVSKNEEKYYFHFTALNNIKNILVYKQGDKYKLMDIIEEQQKNNEEDSNSKKLFSNIMSGEIENDSYLIISNQKVIDYVIPDKLKQLVISIDIKEAIKYLKKILTEIDPTEENVSFSSILIYLTDEDEEKIFKPENSIKNLISTEKNTEKFLTPSILPDFKEIFINISKATQKAFKFIGKKITAFKNFFLKKNKHKEKNEEEDTNKKHIKLLANNIKHTKINEKIKKTFVSILKYAKKLLKFIKKIILEFLLIFVSAFRKIKEFSIKKAVLIIIFVIAIVALYKGTSLLNKKKAEEENKITYNESLDELEQKFDSLEANLIYNNYEKSSELLKEIKDIMSTTLAVDIPEYKEKYNELEKKVSEYNTKINKINEVENPSEIKNNLSEINNIAITGDNLALISNSLNKIEIIDIKKETSEEWSLSEENILTNLKYFSSSDDDKILAYRENKNKPYELDIKNKKIVQLTKSFFNGTITDIKNYANNIYTIDTKNNQIYFYKYENGQKWIKDANISLENAINLVIDGNIFVLKNNGEILKYFKGKKENFSLQNVEPALTSPTKFFTDSDAKYLYILDSSNKRVLVFEKECNEKCQLLGQYTSANFNNITDFAVNEAGGIIYVLNNNTVYKIKVEN